MKNLIEKLENANGIINPYYDATMRDIITIKENSKDCYDLISYSFRFGYMQGQKAEKALQRKKHTV